MTWFDYFAWLGMPFVVLAFGYLIVRTNGRSDRKHHTPPAE